MLQLSKVYYNRKILSLRSGGPVGFAMSPVINPNNLKIEGWYATAQGSREAMVLPAPEVRDIISKGIVVDDHMAIAPIEDLIRLRKVIDTAFEPIGKQVITEQKKKLGKVGDYAVDTDSMFIKKLYVGQSLIKNFSSNQLVIDRSQIVEINDRFIKVRDATAREGKPALRPSPQAI